MVFSKWIYQRPNYLDVKRKLNEYKKRIISAASYEELRSAWLDMKQEIECLEYQEEIIFIRHLCGIDYEESLKEVEIQNAEDPEIYSLRDECDLLVKNSQYSFKLENEFGKQIFAQVSNHHTEMNTDSVGLQAEELQLKMQYRKLMAAENRDDNKLFEIFERLVETRRELAISLGYRSYVELGYHLRCRKDYGTKELFVFRKQIQKYITPVCNEIKRRGLKLEYPPAIVRHSEDLIPAIIDMFKELSEETGNYIEEVTRKELYDIKTRANKRGNIFSCCMLPYEKLPFIIGNYSGNGIETGYIVHEFGHGFAFYTAARKQPLYEFHRSSPAVNELHAKTMEHFMYPYLGIFVGNRKKEYIRSHLMHQLENMVYRCAIDEFEHAMYDTPQRTKRQICELWADISRQYMPWNKISLEEIKEERCWPRQTHIVESPFYYIEYDIAQISTYEFYNRMKQNHEQTWRDYMMLCNAGGSKSYLELLDTANLSNPFAENIVANICCPIINELSSLL